MSANEREAVTVLDLVEEAKKRIILLAMCVVGLSYLMSLTSASVLVNLPAALLLILLLRYMALDYEMRRRAAAYKGDQASVNGNFEGDVFHGLNALERPDWRQKVNSPVVEDAIEQFTRHIVSEWVTDLWYSSITADRQCPEELILVMNGVLGEISSRMKHVNLISLLTRDIIKILCSNLEVFRTSKKLIEKHHAKPLTIEEQDMKLKSVLAAENKLHPILFSPEAEHKVLQQVVEGLVLLTFQPEDSQCSSFRYISRELLSCAVIRPVLNLANPRFVNERIEVAAISAMKSNKANSTEVVSSPPNVNGSPRTSGPDPQFVDSSLKGVELVHLKKDQDKKMSNNLSLDDLSGALLSKDPLLSMDTGTTCSWSSLPDGPCTEVKGAKQRQTGEWGDVLDAFSHRKTEALAPEHFDNTWSKGRNYKFKEDTNQNQHPKPAVKNSLLSVSNREDHPKSHSEQGKNNINSSDKDGYGSQYNRDHDVGNSPVKDDDLKSVSSEEDDSLSSSYTEDDDPSNVMRLDSPGVKVWDSKNKGNFSHIHHPLENSERNRSRHKDQLHSKSLHRTKFARKRTRSTTHNRQISEEGERILLADGHDALKFSMESKYGELSDFSEPSKPLPFVSEGHHLAVNSVKNSTSPESFFRLTCEVLGANIVKCGTKTFAVYSISVADVNRHSWSIKRRYQHFEELHRRLKVFPEYNLHLPPKHFLSSGLGVDVIRERCKLLDQYLKTLFQLPNVSCSIEVWDFLSVDSQMYIFSDSLYIIDTLPVSSAGLKSNSLSLNGRIKGDQVSDGSGLRENNQVLPLPKNPESQFQRASQNMNSASGDTKQKIVISSNKEDGILNRDHQNSHPDATNDVSDPTIPSEWVPPNLSVPILNLVDEILQLKDGGWIRGKTFWAAKQVLQLGMGDAFDDWLIEKIQVLRKGSVIASGIRRLETILWPDGIFITKHPSRQRVSSGNSTVSSPTGSLSSPDTSPKSEDTLSREGIQQREAERRAQFVYEMMIDNAPAVIVGLVGRKEYKNCAKDLYYFIQSSVFLKKLAFELLQLVILSAFPELDHVFKEFDQEKDKFGVPILS